MPADDCRTTWELERLLAGPLPDDQADRLARHLGHCERCAGRVDQLLGLGPNAGPPPGSGSAAELLQRPQVRQLLGRLRALRPDDPPGTQSVSQADAHTLPPATPPDSGDITF